MHGLEGSDVWKAARRERGEGRRARLVRVAPRAWGSSGWLVQETGYTKQSVSRWLNGSESKGLDCALGMLEENVALRAQVVALRAEVEVLRAR